MSGFSVLAWVKDTSPLLQDVSEETRKRLIRELLRDFSSLLGVRWQMDINLIEYHNTQYAYGNNARITVGERTIRNAMGDLANHVEILRGGANSTAEDLANYKAAKAKWNVPDTVTDSTSSGWGGQEQAATSWAAKRQRY